MDISFKRAGQLGIGILLGIVLIFSTTSVIMQRKVSHGLQRAIYDFDLRRDCFSRVAFSFSSIHAKFYKYQGPREDEFDTDKVLGEYAIDIRELLAQVLGASPSLEERQIVEQLMRNEAHLRTAIYAYAATLMEHPTTDNRQLLREEISRVVESSATTAMQVSDRAAAALTEARDAHVKAMASVSMMFAVGGGLTLMTGLGVSVLMTRVLAGQVRQILHSAQQLRQGNLDYRINSPHRDILGCLAGEIDSMAANLHESIRTYKDEIAKRARVEDELKKYQELLEQANAKLEQRVQERTADLVKANEQTRQAQAELVQAEKMGMLGQLVAGVAHEINTPTGAIMNVAAHSMKHLKGFAAAAMEVLELPREVRQWLAETIPHVLAQETVVSGIDDYDSNRQIERELQRQGVGEYSRIAEVMAACGLKGSDSLAVRSLAEEPALVFLEHLTSLKAFSQICRTSVRKIAMIVKALRYYSRGGEGEMFDVSVNESIDNTIVILQSRIKHIAEVEKDYQDSLPAVRCGPDISQVWTNLLSNACDAVEGFGGREKGLIRITTATEDNNVIVEVFNEGPPIPEDVMTRVFDPFVTTKPIGKGTGLGLSICTGILHKYGGRIEARNDAGGVTFRVSLPLVQRDGIDIRTAAAGTAEPVATQIASGGGRQWPHRAGQHDSP